MTPRPALAALVFLLAASRGGAGDLVATFIGNAAFHITDGEVAILTDFPYESGAFGYMQWSDGQVPRGPRPLCLFTHSHRDHFSPERVARFCDLVVGPSDVLRRTTIKRLALEDPLRWKGVTIRPIATPHASVEHYSYLVEWQGQRLFFSGDTDDTSALLAARDLDVAFVNPWLLESLDRAGTRLDARRIVTCHHKPGATVQGLNARTVPAQGEVLRLPSRQTPGPLVAASPDSVPLPAAPAAAEDEEFAARFKEAVHNVEGPPGQQFMQGPFSQHFSQGYATRLSECMQQASGEHPSDFEMAIKLSAEGRVEEALVRPRSRLATCFADSVRRDTFAKPPSAGFWLPVGIHFTKQ